ncbi:glyoxalase/bleomycin resistance/dioxygenase family protein [Streptomyces sp. JH002]|uniref:VOC family protein n=1 Tax=Streptomyces TaxID=1883 RepID=UPI003690BE8D
MTAAATPALHWKLVIDTADAHRLADFWAGALGYTVEDHSTLIDGLLAAGHIDEDALTEHHGRRVWAAFAAVRHPDEPYDPATGIGQGHRILFQNVPEGGAHSGKNRLHIDVHGERGHLTELVERLETLGATRVREVDQGMAGHWWIMTDPEGNFFCAA